MIFCWFTCMRLNANTLDCFNEIKLTANVWGLDVVSRNKQNKNTISFKFSLENTGQSFIYKFQFEQSWINRYIDLIM